MISLIPSTLKTIAMGASCLLFSSVIVPAEPIRILPLGDSITQGGRRDREEYTYRLPLFRKLKDAGVDFVFIGSLQKGLQPQATWPESNGMPFDPNHEGHYGWKTGKVRDHLSEWIPQWQGAPDIALIHLGTNDQKSQDFQKDIIQPLKEIIATLREKNPQIIVLVGHLNFNAGPALEIRNLVEQMARELNTKESPVITVHHYRGWHEKPDEPDSDTFDWAHPNPKGQEKMATNWFEAMKPYLKIKSASPANAASQPG